MKMTLQIDSVIAVFDDHLAADAAVGKLIDDGFDLRHFSVVGKGYRTDEKIVRFCYAGDRMKFWGKYGVFWGGLWGLFFGELFVSIPAFGTVIVLGYLAASVVSAMEGAIEVGGLSPLGAALASIGIPTIAASSTRRPLRPTIFY
ncbi:MAG: permease [Betaproteobacteria bacterium]